MAVHQTVQDRVLVVTIDNPGVRNAFDGATITALREVFEHLAYRDPLPRDENIAPQIGPGGAHRPHVVVLRATGQVFCAGAHLGEMKQLGAADYQTNLQAALEMGAMFRAVRACPVPVVARVQGPAYGGGVGLVAACDVVVAAPSVRFAFTEVRLGIVPGVIAPLVVDRMGQGAARTAFLTGDAMDAAEAARRGLVDRLAATDDDLDGLVETTVASLLQGGPEALGSVKTLLEGIQSLGYSRSAEVCARLIAEARTRPEGQAALAAFAAKEQAPWHSQQTWRLPPEEQN
ncbi:MAG: hypothetical protein GY838_01265 [bacterium]|nr:hypothetical protein [bacterium]